LLFSSDTDVVLQFMLSGLYEPKLATIAGQLVQSICHRCCDRMTNHFDGLLKIVQTIDSFNVSNEAVTGLLKGLSGVGSWGEGGDMRGWMNDIFIYRLGVESNEIYIYLSSRHSPRH